MEHQIARLARLILPAVFIAVAIVLGARWYVARQADADIKALSEIGPGAHIIDRGDEYCTIRDINGKVYRLPAWMFGGVRDGQRK